MSQFKSVGKDQSLEIRPLTVLAGPNSSGKSSVIQSILLLAQTLASKVSARHLVLNGDLVKLGLFDDILHKGSPEQSVSLGFTVDIDLGTRRLALSSGVRHSLIDPLYFGVQSPPIRIRADVAFGAPIRSTFQSERKSDQLQADVREASFSLAGNPIISFSSSLDRGQDPDITITSRSDQEVEQLWKAVEVVPGLAVRSIDKSELRYSIKLSPSLVESVRRRRRYSDEQGFSSGDIVASRLDHFLPSALVVRSKILFVVLQSAVAKLSEWPLETTEVLLEQWESQPAGSIYPDIAKAIRDLANNRSQSVRDFVEILARRKRVQAGAQKESAFTQLLTVLRNRLGANAIKRETLEQHPVPDEMQLISVIVQDVFSMVRYLGPLRDDPKPVYSLATSVDPQDVGAKGQNTAAVLDTYGSREIDFVPPSAPPGTKHRKRLDDAVKTWLNYFSMAQTFSTAEEGKLGHRLLIQPSGLDEPVDLTNVGVGVSQLLPILVMALNADPGSVLLFEQPELHLHPAVQSLLADFFLTMIESGRQCIVETHSEYLINRLRLRVAESALDSTLHNQIGVYFTERATSVTTFRKIEISRYGSIAEWPLGFFDQGPQESERILIAGMRKRRMHLDGGR